MAKIVDVKPNGDVKVGKIVGIIAIIIGVLIIFFNLFVSVKSGHTGVVTTFGKVEDSVLSEGLHIKIPFIQNIIQVDNRILKAEAPCVSASKDLQTVSSSIALNYRVDTSMSADLYKNVGLSFESTIVNPAIQECVKAVSAQYTAEELITNRQSVGDEMRAALSEKISPYGLNIEVFNIISFEFSAEFDAAIEAKQTAQQNALKAEQDLERIKIEAQQQIEQAKAEAEAYKLKNQEITDKTLIMEYINKWDGKLPVVSSDGTMMFDINEFLKQAEDENGNNFTGGYVE